MNRPYEIFIEIMNFDPKKRDNIIQAVLREWPNFAGEHGSCSPNVLAASGEGRLRAGERDTDFAARLAMAVYEANGGWCKLWVTVTALGEF